MTQSLQRLIVMIAGLILVFSIALGVQISNSSYDETTKVYTDSYQLTNGEIVDSFKEDNLDTNTQTLENIYGNSRNIGKGITEIFGLGDEALAKGTLNNEGEWGERVIAVTFNWIMAVLLGLLIVLEIYLVIINKKNT